MAAVPKVMESIVILDDDDAEEPSSSMSSALPQTMMEPPPTHISESPFATAKKESHVLKLENEKLFGEFVDHCLNHTREHPEVMEFLKVKYSKASPDFLSSVEFRNAVGRCLTRAQAHPTKTFVYINELCTILKQHSTKRRVTMHSPSVKKQDKTKSRNEEGHTKTDVNDGGDQTQTEEERKPKRASRRQIAYLENLLKVYSDEIRRLQERDLSLEDLEKEDSSYIQEHKLKRKLMKIYDKLCELKDCSTLTGRVIEQRIRYTSTRYPELNKKIERFLNNPEIQLNPPDYRDILYVVKRTNERHQLMLSRKQEAQIAQEAFRETGSRMQERRHLDMVYNFGSHLTDLYKPTQDPALNDPMLAQKLRSNREVALSSIEGVINKYANIQDDAEEEERKKRLGKEKQKKENGQQVSVKVENGEQNGEANEQEEEEDDEAEEEEPEEEEEEDEEDDDASSDPDIEEEIQASAAQVRPDEEEEEEEEEEHMSVSDEIVQPSSVGSCPSVKSPACGETAESTDEVPQSDGGTHASASAEKSPEGERSSDSPLSLNGHSGEPKPPSGEDEPPVTNSCPSIEADSIILTSDVSPTTENCIIEIPEVTKETTDSKKRKRESKKNHIQNGKIRQSDTSDGDDVSPDVKVACSPVLVDSTRADTPTQDLVSSSRSTPPPKKHKVNVATQCDPDEVIVLSDSD